MSRTTNSRLLTKKLKDSVFGRNLYLVCGPHDEARSYLQKRFNLDIKDTPQEEHLGLTIKTEDESIIWLTSYTHTSEWYSIVAHECLHVTFDVLAYAGIEYCDETEEVYTYYCDSLVGQITKLFIKK
jgi:hypothetical protein